MTQRGLSFILVAALTACRPPGVIGTPLDSGDTGPITDTDTEDPRDTAGPDTIPDAPEPADAIFSGEELPVFTIAITRENADTLQAEYAGGDHEWVEATFTYEDQEYGPVGLRLKGENSFESFREKPSLKVDFNRYDPDLRFLQLNGITLNNMDNDYSMMHERVAYRVYREAGVPAYRANHALVYVHETVDDEVVSERFYGLYALLENANKDMLSRWFESDEGSLFEIWDVDFYDGYVPCPNLYGTAGCFQLETGDDLRTNIQGVADAMELSGASAIEAAEDHLHLDDFLAYWAVGGLVAQFDAYPYTSPGDDCHVYDDPTSGALWFIPHGMDEAFYYPDSDFSSVNGIIAARCKSSALCYQSWKDRVWQAHDEAVEWGWLDYFDEVLAQIEPWVEQDTNKPYGNDYVSYYQSSMRVFIADRERYVESVVGPR